MKEGKHTKYIHRKRQDREGVFGKDKGESRQAKRVKRFEVNEIDIGNYRNWSKRGKRRFYNRSSKRVNAQKERGYR